MAKNGYPHMVFVEREPGLDKETLTSLLGELFPGSPVTDKPLRLDLDRDGYTFSFWFEEGEGVADHYATYLPEGARRRWLSRCEIMIDLHGQPDPEAAHAEDAAKILDLLLKCEGVQVFSEETRRFLGMDYGDEDLAAAAPQVEEPPAAEVDAAAAELPSAPPAAESDSEIDRTVVSEAAASSASPYGDASASPAEPAPAEPAAAESAGPAAEDDPSKPTTVWMTAMPEPDPVPTPAPVPAPQPPAEAVPAESTDEEHAPEQKTGLFRRLFGRR